jgi:hypothetical protein
MKQKKIKFLLALLLFSQHLISQDFSLKWSEKVNYDNKKGGFFKEFLGETEKNIFVLYNNLALREKKANKQLIVAVHSKENMQKTAILKLINPKNEARTKALKGLKFVKMYVQEGLLNVFWAREDKEQSQIYAEIYDEKLEKVQELSLVYEVKYDKVSKNSFKKTPIFIMGSLDGKLNTLIGTEVPNKDGEISVKYVLINPELEDIISGQIDLPIEKTGKYSGLTSSYEYGKDGNLYIQSNLRMTKEERKLAKKGDRISYSILSVVNIMKEEITTYTMKYENKNIYNFNFIVADKEVKIYGFFNDIEKDPSGTRTHGIFTSTINSNSLSMSDPNFSYFDKDLINELFKDDKEDKKNTVALSKKKRKAAEQLDQDALDNRFVIEDAKLDNKNNVVLFCSKMYNYSVTTCTTNSSGGTTCTTRYYCQKSNVTTFKLNQQGEIIWASNVDRLKTYSGTSIYDLRVIQNKENYYVIYGSSFDIDAKKKSRKSSKSLKEIRDKFEYAIISDSDGEAVKKEFVVNEKGVKKSEKKNVDPLRITVLDNKYYINSIKIGFKPALTAGLCVASIPCFPIIYFIALSGDVRQGKGNIGILEVID